MQKKHIRNYSFFKNDIIYHAFEYKIKYVLIFERANISYRLNVLESNYKMLFVHCIRPTVFINVSIDDGVSGLF